MRRDLDFALTRTIHTTSTTSTDLAPAGFQVLKLPFPSQALAQGVESEVGAEFVAGAADLGGLGEGDAAGASGAVGVGFRLCDYAHVAEEVGEDARDEGFEGWD